MGSSIQKLVAGLLDIALLTTGVVCIPMVNGQRFGSRADGDDRPLFSMLIHPAPLAILKRHMQASKDRRFPELTPGGLDKKLSSSAVKGYGRYRRACGVPDGTDFHSFRRNVITVLEAAGVSQVPIARFVGHKVGTMAAAVGAQAGIGAPAAAVMVAIEAFDKSSDVDPAEAAEIYVDGTAAKE